MKIRLILSGFFQIAFILFGVLIVLGIIGFAGHKFLLIFGVTAIPQHLYQYLDEFVIGSGIFFVISLVGCLFIIEPRDIPAN